ncbi:MAG: tRNA (guanine37-N1)-methyltransferase [Patiriisocius sp.]|jgi:tRNA (guanine37-N1)-methyltransferase
MNFHVITLFPEVCRAYTDASILGRAQKTDKGKGSKFRGKKISVNYYDPRDYANNKNNKVDDKPYGGGPGMVMRAEPVLKAWDKAVGRKKDQKKVKTLIMSPRGKMFDQKMAKDLAKKYDHVVLISGRYEGIDYRVNKALKVQEVSVGEYVLTGGELPALTIIDAVARQVPGVLGTFESLEDDRSDGGPASAEFYTRPAEITYKKKKLAVPPVFLGGNHAEIVKYRAEKK